MQADRYYGATARDYEKKRSERPDWQREQEAVERFVRRGPVLDCPIGTGRYVSIYERKGFKVVGADVSKDMIAEARKKHPDLEAHIASILDLPFRRGEFGTAVCSRLLNWLYPVDMAKAVEELRRVGHEVIAHVRTGEKGQHPHQANFTHSLEDFLAAFEGMMIVGRAHILSAPDGEVEFFHFKRPTWKDVRAVFEHHKDGAGAIQRLGADWTANFGLKPVNAMTARVRGEFWHQRRLEALIEAMEATTRADGRKHQLRTDEKPFREDGPLVVLRTQGREALLDGRRRVNASWGAEGIKGVLVLEVAPHVAEN